MAWSEPFVYFGTSEFSGQVLEGLLSAGCRPELVVTTRPKPAGRDLGTIPTPIAILAGEAGLAVLEVSTLKPPLPPELLHSGATFGVLASFGRILPPELLTLYPRGIVNVHPSLLPKYR
ncbi:MAG: formyltransferase family protein, partial [Candidatus Veblenbacteria bacterium]|nr:formyltransferase family protein [Candidatus Veblenbacteria bacterium]